MQTLKCGLEGFETVDAMQRGRDGAWYSYSYAKAEGRVIYVTFFDHTAASPVHTEYFMRAA
jgi:hypothetical protein